MSNTDTMGVSGRIAGFFQRAQITPLLALVAVWLYTVIFVFSACWFAHFALAGL